MSVSESSHEEHSSLDYNNEVGTGRDTDIPHDALSTCMLSDHAHFDTNLSSIIELLNSVDSAEVEREYQTRARPSISIL